MNLNIRFVILVVLIFAGIEAASAENSLSFQRALYVNEWDNTLGSKENIDIVIDNAIYMNCDAIFMYVGSEYYEAVRDPVNKGSWDSRASWNMLEYAINKAHSENIQLHVWMPINIINSPIRAEYKLFGTEYNQAYRNGAVHNSRIDHAFIPAQDYAVGLAGFIAGHYPNLDGIHYEEPYYTSRSYSTAMRDRVKAKYGYDPLTKPEADMIPIIDDVARDVYIELFTKLRASINANKANPNLLFSANAADGYRSLHGFDPRYMSDNHLLDFYAAQVYGSTLGGFKYSVDKLKNEVDDIPIMPISYITYSKIYPDSNPAFFDQIMKTCEYGGNAEAVFSYPWRNKVVEGITAYKGLHNLPPSSSGDPSTIVSTPTLSIPAGTYPDSQSIFISTSTTDATIRYTEDGTTPTETSSIYSTPIVVSSTTTLKAKAWKTGLTPSAIATATYTIGTPAPVQTSIENPGFESGTTSWKFYTSGTGTFSTVSPGYEGSNTALLALSSGGSNIQLYQTGIALEPDTRYRLSFTAYSTTGHDVTVRLFKHVSPYTAYAPDFRANLGTSWQTFTTEFTTNGLTGTVNDGRLQFWFAPFAESGDSYYIDDVGLEKVSAIELPIISTHPADQTVVTGQTATFSVVATGTAPLTYQWQKNSMDIPGATSPSYTTPATILADSGSTFCVQVTNPAGSIMSNAATCTIGTQAPVLSSIKNPGFESGTTSWKFYTNGAGTFSTKSPGYEGSNTAQVALSSGGSNIQLYQTGIALEPDTRYRLSFAGYSTTGHDTTVRLLKHVSPYTVYAPDFTANLGTIWQTFTTEFTTNGFTGTVDDGRLQFKLAPFAASGDNYYIDDVRLEIVNDANTTHPTVAGNDPKGTNIPVSKQINITFSETMDQTSVELAFSTSPVTAGSFSWNGDMVTYIPSSDLAFDTTYTVNIGTGAMDLEGNILELPHSWEFTTEHENIPPTVTDNTPTGTSIPVNAQITVTFSEMMDQTSVESAFSTSPVTAGSFSWNGDMVTYTPSSDLAFDTTYTVNIGTGAMDLAGNLLELPHSWEFTTEHENIPPIIIDNTPTGTSIPVTAQVIVTFSETMDQTSVESAFSTSPVTAGSFSWNGDMVTYTPSSDLAFDTTYTINIGTGAMDLAGNNLQTGHTWKFTTEVVQTSNDLILNPGFESGTSSWLFYTSGTGTFSVASPGFEEINAAKLALNSGSKNIQLYQIGVPLEPDTRYRLSFAGYSTSEHDVNVRMIKHVSPYTNYGLDFTADLGTNWQTFTTEFTSNGFSNTVNDGRFQFWLAPFAASGDTYYIDDIRLEKVNEADITLPTVTGNEPTGTNVPVTTQIDVTFSEMMDQTSVESAFSTSPVTAGSFSWNGDMVTYTPSSDLAFDTTYTVNIGTGAMDLAGNLLELSHSWEFTTEVVQTSNNLIQNPGFESGTTQWTFYTNGKGTFLNDASGDGSPHAGHITISQEGSNVQLYQPDLVLEPNTLYRLSFKAYSNTGHDLSISLHKHESPYTNYGLSDYVVNLGTSWSEYSTQFTTSEFSNTVNEGRLKFWFASSNAIGDQYFIEDVILVKV